MEGTTPAVDPGLAAALRGLADIALPPPVSMLPQTWAWAVLAGLVLLAIAFALRRWYRHRELNRYRREALGELRQIEQRIRAAQTRGDALAALPALIKRTALAVWPRETIANLSGKGWIGFLDAHSGGPVFPTTAAHFFEEAEYRGPAVLASVTEAEAKAHVAAARHWIEAHHVRS
ncbi:hypothetical protein ASD52_22040 [Ensifer sp. Root142]|uniref:DUF4381 domain-containing protein n=1 Tax=Ensifer sp. Root142 TaxID=1736461 RepID=UPI00070B7B16|nr:DUF4381 domain-containing protein [Ensifer sp. Root142]KQY57982.1 hypothetical protein ASD52_22040 [Ensifer sp. Root142]